MLADFEKLTTALQREGFTGPYAFTLTEHDWQRFVATHLTPKEWNVLSIDFHTVGAAPITIRRGAQ